MPITHHVDRELNILFVTRSGPVSSLDEQKALRARRVDRLVVPGIPVLVDCRWVEPSDNSDTVKYIADKVTKMAARLRCGPVAIVVSSQAEFGMARMYQIVTEPAHPDTGVFLDYDKALEWIEEMRSSSSPS